MRLLAATFALATLVSGAHAQSVDAATRAVVVDRAISQIRDHYVDASAGAKVEAALRSDPHVFDDSTGAQAFADDLTKRLQSVVADRHLHVEYSPEPLSLEPVPDAGEEARRHARDERSNYGVERVERLPGNIGYIDLRSFAKTAWAADTLAAAMTLVAHADALIIDLRHNGGGYPATAVLLESYLFDARTHVVDIYWREGDRTEQFWTQDSVAGSRFGQEKPIWLLTSTHTFSGAEGFAYDLKNLKRATVVGETTGGGANPGKFVALASHFGLVVPTGRAISPITHGNWEGTGVAPDVKVNAGAALVVAQRLALTKLIASETDEARKATLQKRLDALR